MRRALPILAVVLAACSAAGTTTTTAPPAVADVWNTTYSIVRIVVGGADLPLVPGSNPSVTFSGTDVNGTTGCNSFFGTFSVDGDSISFDQLGQTEMGCDERRSTQEQQIMAVLAAADRWGFEGDILTVGAAAGTGAIELGPGEGPPATVALEGTVWILDSLVDGDRVSSTVAGSHSTLTIDGGTVGGDSGCNTFGAEATLDPPTIAITDLTTTERACVDQPIMDQEGFVYDVLGNATSFAIDGDQLTIEANGRSLVYRAGV
jgi:heat shock protein HslJ